MNVLTITTIMNMPNTAKGDSSCIVQLLFFVGSSMLLFFTAVDVFLVCQN